MAKQKLEIECPVCDAKLSIDARSCPKCGADLGMADFQDLENLANDISEGRTDFQEPTEKEPVSDIGPEPEIRQDEVVIPPKEEEEPQVQEPRNEPKPKSEAPAPRVVQEEVPLKEEAEEEAEDDKGKKKGLFSKLFGKKK
jgi:hypothetical protein